MWDWQYSTICSQTFPLSIRLWEHNTTHALENECIAHLSLEITNNMIVWSNHNNNVHHWDKIHINYEAMTTCIMSSTLTHTRRLNCNKWCSQTMDTKKSMFRNMIRQGLLSNMFFIGSSYLANLTNFLVHSVWASSLVAVCIHTILKRGQVAITCSHRDFKNCIISTQGRQTT